MRASPTERKYATSHEWVLIEDDIAIVGITDHAQEALGDLVFVELPDVGDRLSAHDEAGVVESVKAASDIFAPLTGEVIAINEALVDSPEIVNSDPYHDGWMYKIRFSDAAELDELLSAEDYDAHVESEEH
jgi:glycine cleavage system H protein